MRDLRFLENDTTEYEAGDGRKQHGFHRLFEDIGLDAFAQRFFVAIVDIAADFEVFGLRRNGHRFLDRGAQQANGAGPCLFRVCRKVFVRQPDFALPSGSIEVTETSSVARALPGAFFDRAVDEVARELIGVTLLVEGVGGVIVETESYDSEDPASHCYGGRETARNRTMLGPPAHAYVYRSYGVHWCVNFVCRPASAVLIRALEPTQGLDEMRARRGLDDDRKLCAGPGRLCEALAITGALDGASLLAAPFVLRRGKLTGEVTCGKRIGITKAADAPRRFVLAGSRYLSRPLRPAAQARL
jgi:DNA-3-methyladenine glycosylase